MSEPGRTRAYDEDLRWRMVWQRLINGYTIKVAQYPGFLRSTNLESKLIDFFVLLKF